MTRLSRIWWTAELSVCPSPGPGGCLMRRLRSEKTFASSGAGKESTGPTSTRTSAPRGCFMASRRVAQDPLPLQQESARRVVTRRLARACSRPVRSGALQPAAGTRAADARRVPGPVAVPFARVEGDDLEGLLLARTPRFQALLEESRRSIQLGKGLTQKDFWKAVAQRHLIRLNNHPRKTGKLST